MYNANDSTNGAVKKTIEHLVDFGFYQWPILPPFNEFNNIFGRENIVIAGRVANGESYLFRISPIDEEELANLF